MFKDITEIDLRILSLYSRDYASFYSIRKITEMLKINYSHTFKRVKELVKKEILLQEKNGHTNIISLNIKNLETIKLLSFVEQEISKQLKNPTLILIAKEAIKIDPFSCIGIFGSRASGMAKKDSDWDVFIITSKIKDMEKITPKFPYSGIHLEVFSLKEFQDSLISREETVVKHIVRNKQIFFNPFLFYNIIYNWEMIKYAPTQ